MPQVDLETLVSACAGGSSNDRKITCETLAGEKPSKINSDELPADIPPESFWLSKDAEYDWFDRNAFLERKQSTKGIGPGSNSSSQRFSTVSLKTKASIIGLPKTQKASFIDSKRRTCSKPVNIRLFPTKRSESTLKTGSVTEPGSPKVSCMGRVRSKRKKSKKSDKLSLERSRSRDGKRKTGFCSRFLSIFRSGRDKRKPVRFSMEKTENLWSKESARKPLRKSKSVSVTKTREVSVSVEPIFEPAGLGAMKRFASGRRSESLGGDEINGVL